MLANALLRARPSRRDFLRSSAAAAAGLVVGFNLATGRLAAAAGGEAAATGGPFDVYLAIAPDDTVTVISAHMDMGQGIYNGTATLVAEELDADWSRIRVVGGAGNTKAYGNLAWGGAVQGTGGSTGTPSSWERYRKAGAAARAMLVEAAAQEWKVPAGEITVENGVIAHSSGKTATFGALAKQAATLTPPADPPLKSRSDWRYIGNEKLGRLDSEAKTTGRQEYTLDVALPGMLTAVVAHPPLFGARVKSFDAEAARAVKGVVDVVEIPRGVAVVAENTWAALKGRDALTVEWDDSAAETRGTDALMTEYKRLAVEGEAAVARNDGDAETAMAGAATVIEAEYEYPYLAHAGMEPLDAVAWKHDGKVEVWGGHQMPDLYQAAAAEIGEVEPSDVTLHVMMTGGGFGRRAVPDADVIVEALTTAKAIGWRAPVKLVWSREDDTMGGRYRPVYYHTLKAGLDSDGRIVAWQHRIVGQSIASGTPFEMLIKDGVDATSVEGASNLPYAIPNMHVDLVTTEVGVPVLWWRSVGSTHTAYSTEVMMDELAHAAQRDPVAFRLELLKDHPRHTAALELAAEKAGWDQAAPEGVFRGVAVHESFNTAVAQIAEIRMDGDRVRVERVVCAVDCGTAVNPDVVKAQMEGGIGFGFGAVLKGEITMADGHIEQNNFDGYRVLRIEEMPKVEVHIVPSDAAPTGAGEPGVPPVGPAVANAIFAAIGKRIRVLPFTRSGLTA